MPMTDQILEGWEEIARFLRRSVKYCQRLYREKDLPVMKDRGPRNSPRVWTTTTLLIAWRKKMGES